MSDKQPPVPAAEAPAGAPPLDAENAKTAWETALMNFAKTSGMGAPGAPFIGAGMPFPMSFPQGFMFPPMVNPYTGLPPFFPPGSFAAGEEIPTAKSDADASQDGSLTDDETSEEGPTGRVYNRGGSKRRAKRAASLAQKKAKTAAGLGVKSKSQAALALLASTAGGILPTAAGGAASSLNDIWGQLTGQTAAGAAAPVPRGARATKSTAAAAAAAAEESDNPGELDDLDEETLAGMDEKELKRHRRKQSNRESARRSRLRKQAECEALQVENKALKTEMQKLRNEAVELRAQITILNAKLNMANAFQNGAQVLASPAKNETKP